MPRMFGPWSGLTVTAAVVLAVDAVDGDSLALAFGAVMLGKGGSPKVEHAVLYTKRALSIATAELFGPRARVVAALCARLRTG